MSIIMKRLAPGDENDRNGEPRYPLEYRKM